MSRHPSVPRSKDYKDGPVRTVLKIEPYTGRYTEDFKHVLTVSSIQTRSGSIEYAFSPGWVLLCNAVDLATARAAQGSCPTLEQPDVATEQTDTFSPPTP